MIRLFLFCLFVGVFVYSKFACKLVRTQGPVCLRELLKTNTSLHVIIVILVSLTALLSLSWTWGTCHTCCQVAGSFGSRQHWLRDSQKKILISIVFYCSQHPSIAHKPCNHWNDSVGVFSKMYFNFKSALQSNRKLKMSYVMCEFRLISLDRITYG